LVQEFLIFVVGAAAILVAIGIEKRLATRDDARTRDALLRIQGAALLVASLYLTAAGVFVAQRIIALFAWIARG
jgi:uncharacterized membrane protein YsdA (DUF1294 family)